MLPVIFNSQPHSHELSQKLGTALAQLTTANMSAAVKVSAGQLLLPAGKEIRRLPLLLSGRIDCVLPLDQGETASIVPVSFGPGEVVMLSQVFCNLPVWVDLVAAQDCEIQWLEVKKIEALMETQPDLLLLLAKFLSQRLREVQVRERSWVERGIKNRVRAQLARMAQQFQPTSSGVHQILATHEKVAARCGMSRPKVSVELKRLEQQGIIRLKRSCIEILKFERLIQD